MDDGAIVELYWARDSRAIDETQKKYGGYCAAIASNLLSTREDAEECVADTYFAAWNAIPPERPALLRAFLGAITRHIAMDRLKRLGAKKRGGEAQVIFDELSDVLPGGRDPSEELDRRELARDVESFLRSENPRARFIFLRRYWYADGVGTIAGMCGMGENAVSAQLRRTRARLRKFLSERGYAI